MQDNDIDLMVSEADPECTIYRVLGRVKLVLVEGMGQDCWEVLPLNTCSTWQRGQKQL